MKYTLYKHISPSKKVYIGITSQRPSKRWSNGKGYTNNDYFTKAINKYGWENFEHIIIMENLTKEQAEHQERELIKRYKSDNRKYGYNIQHGGSTIGKHTEETKAKIGQANKGNKTWKGRHHKAETKEKLSQIHTGMKASEETRIKLSKAHIGKKQSKESIEKRAEKNKGKKRSEEQKKKISKSLQGHKGVKHTEETKEKIRNKLSKTVRCVDTNITYKGIREASRLTNISSGSITMCCKGQINKAGGYKWEYA